ncbi:MAG: ABC transporter permease [Bacillota bacterium]|nr:ABC transporter permease [Bacillota bacterium]MDW7729499.1 ABC transporter permease [Bacillota bacterium]
MSVIYILWIRQLKRYFRSKARIIGALGQPLLFLFAFGFGFGPVFERAGEGDYMQFLVPGIIAMSTLFTSMFNGIEIIWDRQFGFLKETLVAPVSRVTIMVGRTLGGATVAIIQGLIVLSIALLIGFRIASPLGLFTALLFMFLIATLFTALGTAIASLLEDMHGFQLIMNFLVMPLFFLSGALFPIQELPGFVGILVRLNPLSYGVDGLRGALTGAYQIGFITNFNVLVLCMLTLVIIGAFLFSRIEV